MLYFLPAHAVLDANAHAFFDRCKLMQVTFNVWANLNTSWAKQHNLQDLTEPMGFNHDRAKDTHAFFKKTFNGQTTGTRAT